MPASTKKLGCFVAGFWVVNVIICVLVVAGFLVYSNPSAMAIFISPTPTASETATNTPTSTATATSTPTSTYPPF